ncbi:MAG: ATP-binding cassette domain-containing protein [Geminicoccaceae bacterium]
MIPAGPRLGGNVVDFENVTKGLATSFHRRPSSARCLAVLGLWIGANGVGKTTLFRMITGEEKPDQGDVKLGDTVQLGYVDQTRIP